MSKKTVSIVIGSYNRKLFLISTINSVRSNGMQVPYEIIVVDGGSTDGSLNWLIKQKDIITIIQHNRGSFNGKAIERRSWGYFMNLAFKAAQGKYILMLSDDCLVIPHSIMNGITQFDSLIAQGKKIGAIAFYWRNWPDQKEYNVGLAFGKIFVNHGLYLRSALASVNWINEDDYHFYHADSDLCLKLWSQGYEVVEAPEAYVEHFVHANVTVRESNLLKQKADWQMYLSKWENQQFEGKHYNGEWMVKEFVDPDKTASFFPIIEVYRLKYQRIKAGIRRRIKLFFA